METEEGCAGRSGPTGLQERGMSRRTHHATLPAVTDGAMNALGAVGLALVLFACGDRRAPAHGTAEYRTDANGPSAVLRTEFGETATSSSFLAARALIIPPDEAAILPVRGSNFRGTLQYAAESRSLSGQVTEHSTGRTYHVGPLSLERGDLSGFVASEWLVSGSRVYILGQISKAGEGAILFVDLIEPPSDDAWKLEGPGTCARDRRLFEAKSLLQMISKNVLATLSGSGEVVLVDASGCGILGSSSPVDGADQLVPALTADSTRPGGFDLLVEDNAGAVNAFLYYDSERNLVSAMRRQDEDWKESRR